MFFSLAFTRFMGTTIPDSLPHVSLHFPGGLCSHRKVNLWQTSTRGVWREKGEEFKVARSGKGTRDKVLHARGATDTLILVKNLGVSIEFLACSYAEGFYQVEVSNQVQGFQSTQGGLLE